MKVALFGATGTLGSRIFSEATRRGHAVTVALRHPARAPAAASAVVQADATAPADVEHAAEGQDAVISAIGGTREGKVQAVVKAAHALIAGLEAAGVQRLLIVGGAGGLQLESGGRLVDSPGFPEAWKASSLAQCDALEVYRTEGASLDWTYLSPADLVEPGERTGHYRTGGDRLLLDASGESRISAEDYAIAMIDELEQPAHVGQRFCVAAA